MSLSENESKFELAMAEFDSILRKSKPYELKKLAQRLDEAERDRAVLEMIRREIQFYREKNWTYSKLDQRVHEFPDLARDIYRAIDESVSIGPGMNKGPTTMFTKSRFLVDGSVVGEGGQGVLYKAKDESLGDRQVAIKLVKDVNDATKFRQEAEITAKLEHPGIVPVYTISDDGTYQTDSGDLAEGHPFYAMRFIDGTPLDKAISDLHNDPNLSKSRVCSDRRFIQLVESLISTCHTVSYAHSVGVLHCDIKPKNIMIGDFGATIVLDWGSAVSVAHSDQLLNGDESIKCPEWSTDSRGTEGYASPEQWVHSRGDDHGARKRVKKNLTAASDVYSLGGTLYQIITARTPIDARDKTDRRKRDEMGSVRFINSHCPRSLESICIKAMRLNPVERYQDPEEMAQDLSAWLRGDPVSTIKDTIVDKCFRILNRHRTVSTIVGLLVLGILTSVSVAGYLQYQNRLEKNNLEYENRLEEANLRLQHQQEKSKSERLRAINESGLSLIEEICETLENGEFQNRSELEHVAKKVRKYNLMALGINDGTSLDRDGIERARLYKLNSLTNYFYSNYRATSESSRESAKEVRKRQELLDDAIANINEAIRLFGAADPEDFGFASDKLADSKVFAARLHVESDLKRRSQENGRPEQQKNDLETAKDHLEDATMYFEKNGKSSVKQSFQHAEAYQLLGEVYQRQLSREFEQTNKEELTANATKAFQKCNEILTGVELDEQDIDNLKRRERALGRGHGYLGDIYREHLDCKQSLENYRESLNHRQDVFGMEDNPENRRQLVRGYMNFVRTLSEEGAFWDSTELPKTLDDGSYTGEGRKNEILGIIDRFVGQLDSDDELALSLMSELAEDDASSFRIEYVDTLLPIAELYFQAAIQTELIDEDLLDKSEELLSVANEILDQIVTGNRNRQEKRLDNYRAMLSYQVENARQPVTNASRPMAIALAVQRDEKVTDDELITYCIAISSAIENVDKNDAKRMLSDLRTELAKLAESGNNVWRIRQHLSGQGLEVYNQELAKNKSGD